MPHSNCNNNLNKYESHPQDTLQLFDRELQTHIGEVVPLPLALYHLLVRVDCPL